MRVKFIVLCWIISLSCASSVFGQKTKNSKGEATELQAGPQEALIQTMNRAREAAIINAIENAFGVLVDQQTIISMEGGSANYSVLGQKKVKGEWIKEKTEPEYVFEDEIVGGIPLKKVTCKVSGEVREIKTVPITFEAYPLGAPFKNNKKEIFEVDDNFYVYFRSSNDGYLTIFLKEIDNKVSRILPYSGLSSPKFNDGIKVKGDVEYVFFDKDHSTVSSLDIAPPQVDQLQLYTALDYQEVNTLFVIFSENPIPKPILDRAIYNEGNNFIYPASMNSFDFEKWLRDVRFVDSGLQVAQFRIAINPER